MTQILIKPYDVISHEDLPELSVTSIPAHGDPLEISGDLYFVCEMDPFPESGSHTIGVIPLVVKDPAKVTDIKKYVECLSIAHRKVQFRNSNGLSDLEHSDEMVIS